MKAEDAEPDDSAIEHWFAGRSALLEAEVIWALGGKPPEQGQFETPPQWVGKAIRAFADHGLGDPKKPPAAEVLDTPEKREAAMVGLKEAVEALVRGMSGPPAKPEGSGSAGTLAGDSMARLVSDADAKTADAIGAIKQKRARMGVQEALEYERFKVKGMELITDAESLRSDILVPRIDILYLLWIWWPKVILMPSVAGLHRWLEGMCKSQFSQKLTEKICGELGLKFPRAKKRAK